MQSEVRNIQTINLDAIKEMTDKNITQNRLAAAGRLSFDLVSMIEQEIQSNQFQVNSVQKQFKLKSKQNREDANRRSDKRNEEMEEGQKHNRQGSNSKNELYNNSEKRYYKSQMTQEDIDKIKRIKLMQKKYELQLENKTKLYEQSLKKFHQEQKDLLEKEKKEKNQQRLKEVAKNIQEIRARQEERKKKMEEQKKRILQIKNQKKLYERLDQQYKSVQIQEEKKKQEMKLVMKLQKNIQFDDIKQHQKKYDQIMRFQREQRQKKLGQLVRGNSKKYYQSRLLKQFLDQEQKAKVEHIDKKNQVKQHFLKKQQYAEYVRNNYRPNVPFKEEQKSENNQNTRSLSVHQLNKIGNQYMKQVHENVQNLKGSSVSKIIEKGEPFKYKNYLQEVRVQRKLSSQKQSRYLQQIDSLMKRQNMTQQQKFYKAKMIAQKIEQKKGRDSQRLIESINAKIYLLKQIEPTK